MTEQSMSPENGARNGRGLNWSEGFRRLWNRGLNLETPALVGKLPTPAGRMAFTFGTLLWIVLVGFLMSSGSVRAAQTVVANYTTGKLLTVDLVTGNRTEIPLSTAIRNPVSMAVEADGSLLVVPRYFQWEGGA